MTVFGADKFGEAKLFLPKASSSWDIAGIVGNGDGNVILASFELLDIEAVDIRRCFNETNHIFALGRDIERSVVSADVMVFFGKPCEGSGGKKISDIRSAYEKKRISKSLSTQDIRCDAFSATGFLIRMTVSGVDAATQSCHVGFTFILDGAK